MQKDWISRGKEVIGIEIEALEYVRARLGASFAEAVGVLGDCKGRVAVSGIGKSGLVGRKLAATLSSTGTPAFFLHPVEGAHGDLGAIRDGDVVIAISYSGKSVELNAILPALKSLGVSIIAFTSQPESPLALLADIVIDNSVLREACPLNLAPTSSTTATLALGDALAVCLIELKAFTARDFQKFHPGGALGKRLRLSIADLMRQGQVPHVSSSSRLQEALAVLDGGGMGAVVLLDAGQRVCGILTDGDVRRMLYKKGFDPQAGVSLFMTADPLCCTPLHSAAAVMDLMEQRAVTVLPVVSEDKKLLGIVHLHDLLGKGALKFAG